MHFDQSDALNINDHPKTWNLPDSAVALLARAGEWSARNTQYGFVPADMPARFSSDPVQAVRELLSRGLWQRVKGGYQFTDWGDIGETAGQAAQREADTEAERTVKSAGGRRGNHERWHAKKGRRAPGCEFCETLTAPAEKRTSQVRSHTDRRSDSDATPIDLDLDLSQKSKTRSKSRSARTRGPSPGSPDFRLRVIAKFAAVTRVDIGPETADAITTDVLGAREGVDNPLLYVFRAIENEPNPKARWLPATATTPARDQAAAPEWCGKCIEADHGTYDADGVFHPCRDCHPKFRNSRERVA